MKRIVITSLCLCFLLLTFAVVALAEADSTVIMGDVTAEGDTVEVPVYITAIPNGIDNIMAIDFIYSYDTSVLEYKSAVKGTATGSLFTSVSGGVHWADSVDLSTGNAKITPETVGAEKPFFKLVFNVIGEPTEDTEITVTKVDLSGGFLLDNNTVEIVKAAADSFDTANGMVRFPVYKTEEKQIPYGIEGSRALIFNMKTDGVPYVDGVRALKVDDNKFVFITDAQDPVITVNKDETAELIGWGCLHRDDKVTALDAYMAIMICGGEVYDAFVADKNMYVKADPNLDFEITSLDALAINSMSHGKKVSVTISE